jgi:hypothetical protein
MLKQIIKAVVLLAAAGVAIACAWLTYSEYRFARHSSDLRVSFWSLIVGLLFVAAVVGGLVGVYQIVANRSRKGSTSEWEKLTSKERAGVCVLGAAAVICCFLSINPNLGDRQSLLGVVDPGKVTGYFVRGGQTVGVVREGDSGPTGMLAYAFPALTGGLSAAFTWIVANAVRKAS